MSLDEGCMKSYYTSTKNMGFFDRTSRGDFEYADRFNAKLELAGMQPWVYQKPVADAHAISHWLEENWDQDLPMLDNLLDQLDQRAAKHTMPVCSLNPTLIASKPDLRWQDRVAAAAEPMQCSMGTFGPNAYCRDHLANTAGARLKSFKQLDAREQKQSKARWMHFNARRVCGRRRRNCGRHQSRPVCQSHI